MKHIVTFFLCLLFICLANGQVPNKISYQGLLTTSAGTPVLDGKYNLQFDIYNLPVGGNLNYTETQKGILVSKGTFSVVLRPTSNIFAESLFVEVTALTGPSISSPVTFSPRSDITTAPYAFRADTALYAINLVYADTISGIIGTDFPSHRINIAITHPAFQSLNANQVIATASAYVMQSYLYREPLTVAVRPNDIGTLYLEIMFKQSDWIINDSYPVKICYILTRITN